MTPINIEATLEKVSTRKNVTDDIIQTITLNIYNATPSEIGQLTALYKLPLKLTLEVSNI